MSLALGRLSPVFGGGASGGGGTFAADFYVDSVNGSDANNGRTLATALRTIAAAQAAVLAFGNGARLALVRGSYWREQYTVQTDNLTVGVVGNPANPMPVIDGADVVAVPWTQPDVGTYPNVWSISWTRDTGATGQDYLGLWANGVRPAPAATLADLQANGGWMPSDFLATTATVYIKSVADPNTSGVVYEITRRSHAFIGHTQIIGVTHPGQVYVGPMELKRCVGHYNALGQGPGQASKIFLRDGNVHHSVTEGTQIDVVATEYHPSIIPSTNTFFRAVSGGFSPSVVRGLCLLPGGDDRIAHGSAFYSHGSSGTVDGFSVDQCLVRGGALAGADAHVTTVSNSYCEDASANSISMAAGTNGVVSRFSYNDTKPSLINDNNATIVNFSVADIAVSQTAIYTRFGPAVRDFDGTRTHTYTHCSLIAPSSFAAFGGAPSGPNITNCVFQAATRLYHGFSAAYVGDFNVFVGLDGANLLMEYNSSIYSSLSTFQAASGQDAHSVYVKLSEQVSGNGIALWLGIASGANAGPADGDFRINPAARVYNGAGAMLSGVFSDGVTPITAAGPQEHWNYNLRSVVAGPITRWPILPATIAEMRTYVENPNLWNFYP